MNTTLSQQSVEKLAQRISESESLESLYNVKKEVKLISNEDLRDRQKLDRWLLLIFVNERILQTIAYPDMALWKESNECFDLAHQISLKLGIDLRIGLQFYRGMVLCKLHMQRSVDFESEKVRFQKEAVQIAEYCVDHFHNKDTLFQDILNGTI